MIGPEFAQISQAQFGRLQFPKQERLKSDQAQEFQVPKPSRMNHQLS